jgi:hypothetical protein
MGAAVRGLLIRRLKVRDLKETIPIPTELRSSFRDGLDAAVVVETGRNRRRVCLAISSGAELVVPDWLKKSVEDLAAPGDDISIYLSTRPIWFVKGAQDEAISAASALAEQSATAAVELTQPVSLSPRLPNVDRISETLEIAEGESHR